MLPVAKPAPGCVQGRASPLEVSTRVPLWSIPSRTGLPFFIGGGVKAAYDIAIWSWFRRVPIGTEEAGQLQEAKR